MLVKKQYICDNCSRFFVGMSAYEKSVCKRCGKMFIFCNSCKNNDVKCDWCGSSEFKGEDYAKTLGIKDKTRRPIF